MSNRFEMAWCRRHLSCSSSVWHDQDQTLNLLTADFLFLNPISWDHSTLIKIWDRAKTLFSRFWGHQRSFKRLLNHEIKHLHFQLLANSIVQVLACPAWVFLMHARFRLLDVGSNVRLWFWSVKHFATIIFFNGRISLRFFDRCSHLGVPR